MVDLNKFTYYELELIKEMVDNKIRTKYRMNEKRSSLFEIDDREMDDLILLKVKITEHMKEMEAPDNLQRLKDGKKIKK